METKEYLLDKAFREGIEEGFMDGYKKGLKIGFDEGFEKGLNFGIQTMRSAIALALKNSGFSVSNIAEVTGLSIAELEYLN